MNGSAPDLRFQLDTENYFPRRAEYSFYVVVGAMCLAMAVIAILALNWGSAIAVAVALVAGGLIFFSMRRLRNQAGNYVLLGDSSFDLVLSSLFAPKTLTIAYSEVEGSVARVKSMHPFSYPWPYPMRAWGPHVEVHLRNAVRVPLLMRFPPYVRLIHLSTERLDELAHELRARAGLEAGAE